MSSKLVIVHSWGPVLASLFIKLVISFPVVKVIIALLRITLDKPIVELLLLLWGLISILLRTILNVMRVSWWSLEPLIIPIKRIVVFGWQSKLFTFFDPN